MQTQINWIKYEGRTEGLTRGNYLVYGAFIEKGILTKKMRYEYLFSDGKWQNLNHFIIEYFAPLREIERGIEEAVAKN